MQSLLPADRLFPSHVSFTYVSALPCVAWIPKEAVSLVYQIDLISAFRRMHRSAPHTLSPPYTFLFIFVCFSVVRAFVECSLEQVC